MTAATNEIVLAECAVYAGVRGLKSKIVTPHLAERIGSGSTASSRRRAMYQVTRETRGGKWGNAGQRGDTKILVRGETPRTMLASIFIRLPQ